MQYIKLNLGKWHEASAWHRNGVKKNLTSSQSDSWIHKFNFVNCMFISCVAVWVTKFTDKWYNDHFEGALEASVVL